MPHDPVIAQTARPCRRASRFPITAAVRLRVSFAAQMRRIYTLARRVAEVALPPGLARRE